MKRKKFTIPKSIKKFGHPKSDYKQDGTLKKNKQEPREYWEWENVSVEGKELIVDGKHIGYIIPDYEYECTSTPWCYKIFKLGENGKPERVAVRGVSYDKDNNPTEHIVCYRDYERSYKDYSTKEEAVEEGIKYCLKNLIKNEDEKEESDIPVPKTVDEAISTLVKILSDEDRKYLLENGAISMHDSLGRWIRNEWGLWTGSELKDELMNMNKGLNHPDDMSNYIIEEFIKYWNNKI